MAIRNAPTRLMKDAKRWLELLAERIPNQYEPLARLLIQNSESERAIKTCLDLWRRQPTQEAATLLGRVLLYGETTVDTFQQVEADLAACLERFPNHPTVLFTIGNLRLQHMI